MKQVDVVTVGELQTMAEAMYGNLVKTDVDIAKNVMIIDMELHADGEAYLLENGSMQADLWGINLHPAQYGTDEFIEFDSMINIRPSQSNASKDVLDPQIREKIKALVQEIVHE